ARRAWLTIQSAYRKTKLAAVPIFKNRILDRETPSGSTSTSPTAKTRRRCKRSSSIDGARRDQSGPARVAAREGPAHLAVPQVPAPDLQPRARIFAGVRRGVDRAAHRPGGAAGGHGLGRIADRRRGGVGGAGRRSGARPAGL